MYKFLCLFVILFVVSTVFGESGQCSWYGPGFNGHKTGCGGIFNENALTAAHKTLPCGTRVRVSALGKSVVVTVNDRGPYVAGRILDLSRGAAQQIGLVSAGHAACTVTKV